MCVCARARVYRYIQGAKEIGGQTLVPTLSKSKNVYNLERKNFPMNLLDPFYSLGTVEHNTKV